MKAIIESAGKVASRVRLGDHELVFDQPRSVPGGEDRGPSPLDLMAVSVAACAHYYAAAFLYARGLSTEGLSVEVEFEKERLPVSRIGHLALKVHLPAGLCPPVRPPACGRRARDQELPGLRDAAATAARRDLNRSAPAGSRPAHGLTANPVRDRTPARR